MSRKMRSAECDVAVIGGGVVGCAILHELTNQGFSCILLEKNEHLISGASSGNSGQAISFSADILRGSLEEKCLQHSAVLNQEFYTKHRLPRVQTDFIVVAWTKQELAQLPKIVEKAHSLGHHDVKQISVQRLLEMEPHLSKEALGAVVTSGDSIVDSWMAPVTMAHVALRGGAQIRCNSEVKYGHQTPDGVWVLETVGGPIKTKVVINAAGLYGDKVEEICHKSKFRIHPRKGQYAVFSQDAGKLLQHVILPVPTDKTKGILVFPTVYGNILVGPTAEEVEERHNPSINPSVIKQLVAHARKVLPPLAQHDIIGTYAGLRPATQFKDYQIYAHPDRNWLTVGGIRSTGVSACLAIAKHVHGLLVRDLQQRPSGPPPGQSGSAPYWVTNKGTVVLDGAEYTITHGIPKFGLQKYKAKL